MPFNAAMTVAFWGTEASTLQLDGSLLAQHGELHAFIDAL